MATVRSKKREIVAFEATLPNAPGLARRMSKSLTCSPPAASISANEPRIVPGRCVAPDGTNCPKRSSHNSRKSSASTNEVSTFNPAWEISDWPVVATEGEGKLRYS